jgi:hypothetical protein
MMNFVVILVVILSVGVQIDAPTNRYRRRLLSLVTLSQ